jgi:hypothetical protein
VETRHKKPKSLERGDIATDQQLTHSALLKVVALPFGTVPD